MLFQHEGWMENMLKVSNPIKVPLLKQLDKCLIHRLNRE